MRAKAAEILGRIGNKEAAYAVIQVLKDLDSNVRVKAAEALGKLDDTKAVEPLTQCLKDSESSVRANAAEALGKLMDHRAVDPLLQLFKDSSSEVRAKAAEALGRLGSKRCAHALIAALDDPDSNVRAKAVEALGIIGDSKGESLPSLIKCPNCNKLTKQMRQSREVQGKTKFAGLFIVLGFILTPLLIGIPIALYGSHLTMQKLNFWICEHCKHQFELHWYQ